MKWKWVFDKITKIGIVRMTKITKNKRAFKCLQNRHLLKRGPKSDYFVKSPCSSLTAHDTGDSQFSPKVVKQYPVWVESTWVIGLRWRPKPQSKSSLSSPCPSLALTGHSRGAASNCRRLLHYFFTLPFSRTFLLNCSFSIHGVLKLRNFNSRRR